VEGPPESATTGRPVAIGRMYWSPKRALQMSRSSIYTVLVESQRQRPRRRFLLMDLVVRTFRRAAFLHRGDVEGP